MITDSRIAASRYLSRLNLNTEADASDIKTYWCRVAFPRFETYNDKEQSHSFFELHMCISGNCELLLDKKPILLSEKSLILIPPGKKHTILSVSEDFEKLVWGFLPQNGEEAEILCRELSKNDCPIPANASLFESVERILREGERGAGLDLAVVKNELYYIYTAIFRAISDAPRASYTTVKAGVRAEAVKNFISDNLSANLSVSDIAAQFYMSERQLERICVGELHKTVGELRRELQAEAIRSLLSDTTLPLNEIARLTGFSDRYSMGKFFKKAEGMPPAKYRSSILE